MTPARFALGLLCMLIACVAAFVGGLRFVQWFVVRGSRRLGFCDDCLAQAERAFTFHGLLAAAKAARDLRLGVCRRCNRPCSACVAEDMRA